MIITISRQVASNGELIGRGINERQGLRFFDRDLVDELARRLQASPSIVARTDELALAPVQSILLEWQPRINEQVYAHALRQALAHIRNDWNAVIIVCGAAHLLRGADCLHVRITAPLAPRIAIARTGEDASYADTAPASGRKTTGAASSSGACFMRTSMNLKTMTWGWTWEGCRRRQPSISSRLPHPGGKAAAASGESPVILSERSIANC